MGFLRFLNKILDRACVIAGALLLSQAPMFMQHYTQHLSGRVAELELENNKIAFASKLLGKNAQDYTQFLLQSKNPDIAAAGALLHNTVMRTQTLSNALTALREATPFTRPFVFIAHLDYSIVKDMWPSFVIGIPMNTEGLLYALFGMLFGYLFYYLLRQFSLFVFRQIRYAFSL